ncbi:spore wall synthesis complex protein [Nocardioides lentus]|uniref:Spore wall synthesis complex protein n=1 Tax=Nocardioides lentus TaxID=338077 RepID=A0ABN2P557_9ACTN
MPLSEEELRMLEQMERALVEEDPKLASTMRGTTLRRAARRRAIGAGVVFLGGVAVLMGGAVSGYTVVGIVGFVIMLASATLAVAAVRSRQAGTAESDEQRADPTAGPGAFTLIEGGRSRGRGGRAPRQKRGRPGGSGSFMERMEQRWRRRRDNG